MAELSFSEALRQLQQAHERHVAKLNVENRSLRTELEELQSLAANSVLNLRDQQEVTPRVGATQEQAAGGPKGGAKRPPQPEASQEPALQATAMPAETSPPKPPAEPQDGRNGLAEAAVERKDVIGEIVTRDSSPSLLSGEDRPKKVRSRKRNSRHSRPSEAEHSVQLGPDGEPLTVMDILSNPEMNPHFDEEMAKVGLKSSRSWQGLAQKVVLWQGFDMAIGFIILLNAGTIGWESELKVQNESLPTAIMVMEYIFLAIYVFELVVRVCAWGKAAFRSHWVKFDLFLVICGFLDIFMQQMSGLDANFEAVLQKIMILRILRLCRIVRVLRLMVQFRALWLLVNGLIQSVYTLGWVVILIFILLYVFAIFGLEILTPDFEPLFDHHGHDRWTCEDVLRGDGSATMRTALAESDPSEWLITESDARKIDDYNLTVCTSFGDLYKIMLTLLQGLTLDSVGSIYRPIVVHRHALLFYFLAFILTVSIALMNLVTAIMVESALSQASQDKEAQKKEFEMKQNKMIKKLERLFIDLDADGSQTLTAEELCAAPDNMKVALWEVTQSHDENALLEIFELLDYDDSGHLEIEEFCTGLLLRNQGKSLEQMAMLRQCRDMLRNSHHLVRYVDAMIKDVKDIKAKQDQEAAGLGRSDLSTLWC